MPINYSRLIKELKPPPGLSLLAIRVSFWVSLFGIIASIILGLASFTLALKVKDQAVSIDSMSVLIDSISAENITLTTISKQNAAISAQNSRSIDRLELILRELKLQHSATNRNTEPNINIGVGIPEKMSDGSVNYYLAFTNSGSRDAKHLNVITYSVYETSVHDHFDVIEQLMKDTDAILSPIETKVLPVKFYNNTDFLPNNWTARITFFYKDVYVKNIQPKQFYIKPHFIDGEIKYYEMVDPRYRLVMDSVINAQIKERTIIRAVKE
jgi:hypothetical protein